MTSDPLMPLDCLRAGEWGEILDVEGEAVWVARLGEMGLRAGARVQMLRGGCPCLVAIGGGRVSIRCDSVQILVRPVPT